jgi:hypothetical protein
MKFLKYILIVMLIIAAVFGTALMLQPRAASAGPSNPATGASGYQVLILPISAITATTTGIVKFNAPWNFRVNRISSYANSVTGTVTVDVKNSAGTSLLSSAMTLSTVYTEGTVTTDSGTRNITDETAVSVNTANTGSATNVTLLLEIKRL